MHARALTLLALLGAASAQHYYDTFTGKPTSQRRVEELRAQNALSICAIEVKPCDPNEPRRLDYTCNNLKHPTRGGVYTPYHRLLPPQFSPTGGLRASKSGRDLPNARKLRIGLLSDARKENRRHTQMITYVALLITGDTTSIHDTVNYVAVTQHCCSPRGAVDPACMPIEVAEDDLYLRNTDIRCFNLTRAITFQTIGCVPKTIPAERVNSVSPMLDMSNMYGNTVEQAMKFRVMSGGRLKMEVVGGRKWPPNFEGPLTPCLLNEPPNETRCHDPATNTPNILFGGNFMFLLYFREHNRIAKRLELLNPCWDDDQLYYTVREIIIAMAVQVIYHEWAPEVLGYDYLVKNKVIFPGELHVDDYDPHLEPRVSIEYVTASRWFHVLQEGRGNLYNKKGKLFGMVPMVDLTLRTGLLPINNTLDGLMQGSFRQGCAFGENTVDPDMGERVLAKAQRASDVISSDLMKGRDMGLPPYNDYRRLCKLPLAKSFKDLYKWMGTEQALTMEQLYETVDDVDVMAGILAENPMPGAMVGPTLGCIMADQLLRWRRADRFWYQGVTHPHGFSPEQLKAIQQTSFAKVMCNNGETVEEIQPNVFVLPGPGNEIKDCKYYKDLDLEPWRDPKCYAPKTMGHQYQMYDERPRYNYDLY